jgi:nitroreductase
MDVRLAVASRREVRQYAPEPLPDEVVTRILDAGRLAGSAQNRQPWQFLVLDSRERIERLAAAVFAPENLLGASLVVAIVVRGKGPITFDAGRAAQNMLLQAWSEGVGSSPNGIADTEAARAALDLDDDEEEEEKLAIVLGFGWPARPRDPSSRTADEWSARAKRRSLDEVVRRVP